jgi:hypothetical protein
MGLSAANYFNNSKFGFETFADSRSAGRNVFIVNEGNTIFKRGVISTYVVPATTQANVAHLVGSSTLLDGYPIDTRLKTEYSKID